MATLEDPNIDHNSDSSPNILALASQVAVMSYQIVEQTSIISAPKYSRTERTSEYNFRPAKAERNIELTQDYLIDLAVRIEKMCGMIFGLNPSSN